MDDLFETTPSSVPPTEIEKPVTPVGFLEGVRTTILGEAPSPSEVERFNNSLAGKALDIVETYYSLMKLKKEKYPFINPVGSSREFHLGGKIGSRRLGVKVGSQLTIDVSENGEVEIKAPMSGGDDVLKPEIGYKLTIDYRNQSNNPEITPDVEERLETILELVKKYYKDYNRAIPLAKEFKENIGMVPPSLFPTFPADAIRQLRHGKKVG